MTKATGVQHSNIVCPDCATATEESPSCRQAQASIGGLEQCDFDAIPEQNWPGFLRVLQHLSRSSKEGHFVRRSSNVKSYIVSKSVDSKLVCPPKLPVMAQK